MFEKYLNPVQKNSGSVSGVKPDLTLNIVSLRRIWMLQVDLQMPSSRFIDASPKQDSQFLQSSYLGGKDGDFV